MPHYTFYIPRVTNLFGMSDNINTSREESLWHLFLDILRSLYTLYLSFDGGALKNCGLYLPNSSYRMIHWNKVLVYYLFHEAPHIELSNQICLPIYFLLLVVVFLVYNAAEIIPLSFSTSHAYFRFLQALFDTSNRACKHPNWTQCVTV